MMTNARIAIIGAGAAGLSAADKLLKSNFKNVILLEANTRIGGRLWTENIDGGFLEIGAQWIHGETDNVLYKFACEKGIMELPAHTDEKSSSDGPDLAWKIDFYTSNGTNVDFSLLTRVLLAAEVALENCRSNNEHEVLKEHINLNTSVDKYFNLKLEEFIQNATDSALTSQTNLIRSIWHWYGLYQRSIDGCDSLNEMNIKSWNEYKECDGNLLGNIHGGYAAVLSALTEQIPKHLIFLQKSVKFVDVTKTDSKHLVHITCEDGSKYNVDHVIVTVSLGVLKEKALNMFSPRLPMEKLHAIRNTGFGTVNKIYLVFENKFWKEDSDGFSLLWMNEELVASLWYTGIFGFYTVKNAPNTLCGWLSGTSARAMELLSDAEVLETCLGLLKRFTQSSQLPKVVKFYRSKWSTDNNFRGSYSYHTIENSKMENQTDLLIEPVFINKYPAILFAGEATHPKYFSTVHGAMESGHREAYRIIEHYRFRSSQL